MQITTVKEDISISYLSAICAQAGIAYEIIRFAGNNCDRPWVALLMKPGLWLQYMTTREPSDDQIEVAIRALEAARPVEETPVEETQEEETQEEGEDLARKTASA